MSAAVRTLEERVATLEAFVARLQGAIAGRAEASASGASEPADIDGPHGDVVIRKDPPRWTGPSYAGSPMSRCSAEYLDAVAGFLDWRAEKEEAEGKAKYAGYSRKDAARARAWAARLRAGWRPPAAPAEAPSPLAGASWGGQMPSAPERGDAWEPPLGEDDPERPL